MLHGMDLLQKKIGEKKYCITEVVRVKNGFFEYSHERAKYCDIKFNVVIIGREYNVVGEIQFLFQRMFDYKKIAQLNIFKSIMFLYVNHFIVIYIVRYIILSVLMSSLITYPLSYRLN